MCHSRMSSHCIYVWMRLLKFSHKDNLYAYCFYSYHVLTSSSISLSLFLFPSSISGCSVFWLNQPESAALSASQSFCWCQIWRLFGLSAVVCVRSLSFSNIHIALPSVRSSDDVLFSAQHWYSAAWKLHPPQAFSAEAEWWLLSRRVRFFNCLCKKISVSQP